MSKNAAKERKKQGQKRERGREKERTKVALFALKSKFSSVQFRSVQFGTKWSMARQQQ